MYNWIYFRVTGQKNSGWHFELNFSKNCKENSGKKLQIVTISSVNCLVNCLDERELTQKLA